MIGWSTYTRPKSCVSQCWCDSLLNNTWTNQILLQKVLFFVFIMFSYKNIWKLQSDHSLSLPTHQTHTLKVTQLKNKVGNNDINNMIIWLRNMSERTICFSLINYEFHSLNKQRKHMEICHLCSHQNIVKIHGKHV